MPTPSDADTSIRPPDNTVAASGASGDHSEQCDHRDPGERRGEPPPHPNGLFCRCPPLHKDRPVGHTRDRQRRPAHPVDLRHQRVLGQLHRRRQVREQEPPGLQPDRRSDPHDEQPHAPGQQPAPAAGPASRAANADQPSPESRSASTVPTASPMSKPPNADTAYQIPAAPIMYSTTVMPKRERRTAHQHQRGEWKTIDADENAQPETRRDGESEDAGGDGDGPSIVGPAGEADKSGPAVERHHAQRKQYKRHRPPRTAHGRRDEQRWRHPDSGSARSAERWRSTQSHRCRGQRTGKAA